MTKATQAGVSRRGLLVGGAVLGLGMVIGRGALAQNRLSIPYSNKSLDYYFFVIQEASVKRAVLARSGEFQATNANLTIPANSNSGKAYCCPALQRLFRTPLTARPLFLLFGATTGRRYRSASSIPPQTVGMWRLPSASIIFKVASWRRKRSLTA